MTAARARARSARPDAEPAVIWQGFRHSWTYNHRLNRLGDWITHRRREDGSVEAQAIHAAASGSGRDAARFESFHTAVRARGVAFTEVRKSVAITSREAAAQAFLREIRVPARMVSPAPVLAACLNGFDLMSKGDADKLSSFHLAVTAPVFDPVRGEIVCHLLGALNVDCDSPECDLHKDPAGLLAATALGSTLGLNFAGMPGAAAGALFGALFSKLKLATSYQLEVFLLIVEGEPGALAATASRHDNSFDWDTRTAIRRASDGTLAVTLDGDARLPVAVPAIQQVSLVVTRERGLLRPDTAMHLLEWDMAVRPAARSEDPRRVELDLFFRNWRERDSRYLDEQIDLPLIKWIGPLDSLSESIASHRDAGSATATITLVLLEFAAAEVLPGSTRGNIFWEGGNRPSDAPEATARTALRYELAEPESAPQAPSEGEVSRALHIALEHTL